MLSFLTTIPFSFITKIVLVRLEFESSNVPVRPYDTKSLSESNYTRPLYIAVSGGRGGFIRAFVCDKNEKKRGDRIHTSARRQQGNNDVAHHARSIGGKLDCQQ